LNRTAKTLLVLVACALVTMPAWAQLTLDDCPSECRNGGFEVDATDYMGGDYDGTGVGGSSDSHPDHWSFSATDATWSTAEAHDGTYSVMGDDGGYIWQIVHETRASWYYDDTDGWVSSDNDCWDGLADRKVLGTQFWGFFEDPYDVDNDVQLQSIVVKIWGWTGGGAAPSTFDPTSPASGWTGISTTGSLEFAVDPSGADSWQFAQYQLDINFQPEYTAFAYFFNNDSAEDMYIDDICIKGKCLGSDAPELSTWLLLAATGAFGGFVRRRRRT
jgi:hypothetical protein